MTYPMHAVTVPAALRGVANGQCEALMVSTPGRDGGPVVRLVAPAARAWRALCAAALAAGHTLTATSEADSYRTYAVQESTFRARYTTTRIAGYIGTATWGGVTWYQRPGTATAAVPGTSNHGLGLAVDVANVDSALSWLLVNAGRFGWSWELTSEPWHLHYYPGDAIPAAVLDYEKGNPMASDLTLAAMDARLHGVATGADSWIIQTGNPTAHPADPAAGLKAGEVRETNGVKAALGKITTPTVTVDASALIEALTKAMTDATTLSAIATAVLNEQHRRDAA